MQVTWATNISEQKKSPKSSRSAPEEQCCSEAECKLNLSLSSNFTVTPWKRQFKHTANSAVVANNELRLLQVNFSSAAGIQRWMFVTYIHLQMCLRNNILQLHRFSCQCFPNPEESILKKYFIHSASQGRQRKKHSQ